MKTPLLAHLALALGLAAMAGAQDAPPADPPARDDAAGWVQRLGPVETRDQARDKLRDLGAAAVPALTAALKGPDPVLRSEAAFVLGRVGKKAAVPALVEALGDGDPRVRANGAYALGEIADAKALEPLVKALADADPLVRSNACFALGQIGDPKAAPDLVKALADVDENVRNFAASALGSTKEPKALAALAWASLRDPSSGVRALAAASMGTLSDRRACATLVGLLDDKEYVVRARAIEALVAIAADRRGYEPRDADAQRSAAVARWKSWLAKQKAAPVEPVAPMDLYDNWPGRPKPKPETPADEPPPDDAGIDRLIPAVAPVAVPGGDPDAAERAIRQELAANPASASARLRLANLLFARGKVAEPMRLFELLEEDPALPEGMDRATIRLRLAACHRRYGNTDRARALLEDAAAATSAPLLCEAARQFAAMKDYGRARALLERAYNLSGGDAETAYRLGCFLLRVPDDAVRDAERAAAYAEVARTAKPGDERFAALAAQIENGRKTLAPEGKKAENGKGE